MTRLNSQQRFTLARAFSDWSPEERAEFHAVLGKLTEFVGNQFSGDPWSLEDFDHGPSGLSASGEGAARLMRLYNDKSPQHRPQESYEDLGEAMNRLRKITEKAETEDERGRRALKDARRTLRQLEEILDRFDEKKQSLNGRVGEQDEDDLEDLEHYAKRANAKCKHYRNHMAKATETNVDDEKFDRQLVELRKIYRSLRDRMDGRDPEAEEREKRERKEAEKRETAEKAKASKYQPPAKFHGLADFTTTPTPRTTNEILSRANAFGRAAGLNPAPSGINLIVSKAHSAASLIDKIDASGDLSFEERILAKSLANQIFADPDTAERRLAKASAKVRGLFRF